MTSRRRKRLKWCRLSQGKALATRTSSRCVRGRCRAVLRVAFCAAWWLGRIEWLRAWRQCGRPACPSWLALHAAPAPFPEPPTAASVYSPLPACLYRERIPMLCWAPVAGAIPARPEDRGPLAAGRLRTAPRRAWQRGSGAGPPETLLLPAPCAPGAHPLHPTTCLFCHPPDPSSPALCRCAARTTMASP